MRRILALILATVMAIAGLTGVSLSAGGQVAFADGDDDSPYAVIEGTVSMAAPADWFELQEYEKLMFVSLLDENENVIDSIPYIPGTSSEFSFTVWPGQYKLSAYSYGYYYDSVYYGGSRTYADADYGDRLVAQSLADDLARALQGMQ
jgi:hypothetical protein